MGKTLQDLISLSKECEKEIIETEKIIDEIDEIDIKMNEIIEASRQLLANMEDNEQTRELKEKFEKYIYLCKEKKIIKEGN